MPEQWVKGRVRGVSTFESPNSIMRGKGQWWLPPSTVYDDRLYLYETKTRGDWHWAPAEDMLLQEFKAILAELNKSFL
jgi:hypothetical protein